MRAASLQVDFRVSLGEPPEPADQPFGGKIRRRADGDRARTLALQQAVRGQLKPVKHVAHDREIVAAGIGNQQAVARALEELEGQAGSQAP